MVRNTQPAARADVNIELAHDRTDRRGVLLILSDDALLPDVFTAVRTSIGERRLVDLVHLLRSRAFTSPPIGPSRLAPGTEGARLGFRSSERGGLAESRRPNRRR